uniref:Med30_0 protein n=1 Tax=Fopius arisanus TaxID=64838 RepID=A0A0C9RBT1_9HYME
MAAPVPFSSMPMVTGPVTATATTATLAPTPQEAELCPDIIEAIGERIHPERKFAQEIHSLLAVGVEKVVTKGLPTENRKALFEKFLMPKICIFLDPPKLNGALSFLPETVTKRDKRIVEKQERIAASISGLLEVIRKLSGVKESEKIFLTEITELLWGTVHLLSDFQYVESNVRQALI